MGLVVNPVAGLGGRVGLGGTDGPERVRRAMELGARPLAGARAAQALRALRARLEAGDLEVLTVPGPMGADAVRAAGLVPVVVPMRAVAVVVASTPRGERRAPTVADAVATDGTEAVATGGSHTTSTVVAASPDASGADAASAATTECVSTSAAETGPVASGTDATSVVAIRADAAFADAPGGGTAFTVTAGSVVTSGDATSVDVAGAVVASVDGDEAGAGVGTSSGDATSADPVGSVASASASASATATGAGTVTASAHTTSAVRALVGAGVDLLLFAGGDGTARDVLRAVPGEGGDRCPVLGIPTGVKMHSAVFAVGPAAAGEVAGAWLAGSGGVRLRDAEVMDRDEGALRDGRVASRLFGWLPVPDVPARVQQRKTGSTATTGDASTGIAAEVAGRVGEGPLVLGPGTTTRAVATALGADASLAGVDVLALRAGRADVVARDTGEAELLARIGAGPCWIGLSPIGGQGFLLGRGNQQISPRVLRAAGGRDRLLVLCPEHKLAALGGRPLLLDTGDPELDAELSGYLPVLTGHRRISLYPATH
ncbi:hypothetical protein CP970_00170 [Streptomyces kanamyceticus]|uniref:ATP-NAD kinase n=1 Tax=Streptomyces kanamyceticus TaxID=1967 RepID=A0A5J6G741_STRKN|nr:hypothetical protein CP970_00170 [Streptomyces kanamyceticus]